MALAIAIDPEVIARFCRKWRVTEFSFFGSVVGEDFRPDSDVDVLLDFEEVADWSLLDLVAMREELQDCLGRRVDLLTMRAVERSRNWIRRKEILEHRESVYAA